MTNNKQPDLMEEVVDFVVITLIKLSLLFMLVYTLISCVL